MFSWDEAGVIRRAYQQLSTRQIKLTHHTNMYVLYHSWFLWQPIVIPPTMYRQVNYFTNRSSARTTETLRAHPCHMKAVWTARKTQLWLASHHPHLKEPFKRSYVTPLPGRLVSLLLTNVQLCRVRAEDLPAHRSSRLPLNGAAETLLPSFPLKLCRSALLLQSH